MLPRLKPLKPKTPFDIDQVICILKHEAKAWGLPSVSAIAKRRRDPFRVLISCLISLRTKDEVTHEASLRLFQHADDPKSILRLSENQIAHLIYPAGFYRNKARTLRSVAGDLLKRFGGEVPDTIDDLVSLKGVGRKTANLVMTKGFGKPGICVDTHVHRIVNRWGYVKTKGPDETEKTLREKLPRKYWLTLNDLLVVYGKRRCKPLSPICSECPIDGMCRKVGVKRSR